MICTKLYHCCFLLLLSFTVSAQNIDPAAHIGTRLLQNEDTTVKLGINKIVITGNQKTKDYIILREMHLKAGDSVQSTHLKHELELVQQQVYNTNLFLTVQVEVTNVSATAINIGIAVKERWYVIPLPTLGFLDRNINEWLQKYHGDLNRIVYGVKFTHYNLTGRRDLLRITVLNGLTSNLSFSYFRPVSEKSLNNGFSFTGGYVRNREFIYRIKQDNKPLLFNNGEFARRNFFAGIGYSFRKNITGSHAFNLSYNHVSIADSLIDPLYNPNYFKDAVTSKGFVDLSYTYNYVNTNNAVYPLTGATARFRATKRGFGWSGGTNMFSLEGNYNRFWPLKQNWFASIQLWGKTTLPFNQSYINQRAMGYSDINLRGLELYVVDGVAFGLVRTTLKKKLFTINIPTFFKHSDKYSHIPFTVFAKTFADAGTAYNKPAYLTNLNNKFLYTGGLGIDILSIYDFNLRVEYSFNQLGKNGLFLQVQSGL